MKHEHSVFSIAIVLLAFVVGIDDYVGFFMIGFWIARETAQAEYRWIQQYGEGKRENMPWWAVFDKRAWNTDSFVNDLLLPVLFSGAFVWVL